MSGDHCGHIHLLHIIFNTLTPVNVLKLNTRIDSDPTAALHILTENLAKEKFFETFEPVTTAVKQ